MGAAMAVAAGVSAAGTVLGYIGQAKAAAAQRAANEYDATIMEARARDVEKVGAQDAAERISEGHRVMADQRVAFASQGIDVSQSEIVSDVQASELAVAIQDANTIRVNAAKDAWGLRTNASSLRRGGRAAYQSGMMSAAANGLTGAANATVMAIQAYQNVPSKAG